MLHRTTVINTLVGGPAFGCLYEGDEIIKIDGHTVSVEDVSRYIRGQDIPGSQSIFTVLRKVQSTSRPEPQSQYDPDIWWKEDQEDWVEVDVTITRVATAEIADQKRMFDLLTIMKV